MITQSRRLGSGRRLVPRSRPEAGVATLEGGLQPESAYMPMGCNPRTTGSVRRASSTRTIFACAIHLRSSRPGSDLAHGTRACARLMCGTVPDENVAVERRTKVECARTGSEWRIQEAHTPFSVGDVCDSVFRWLYEPSVGEHGAKRMNVRAEHHSKP